MKKIVSALCFSLIVCILLSSACFAGEENTDTLTNWNLRIAVPEGTTAVLKGNEYYIYAQHEDSIPYVMVRTYAYDDVLEFVDDFTEYMKEQYPDLTVTSDVARKTIGDKKCFEIDYTYTVSGYEVRDRRIVMVVDGITYLFASKEIEEAGMTIGNMLDDVVANCSFLSDEDAAQVSALAYGYLYCQEDGMPKYWLDFTGAVADNLVLHCYFRSGDPTFYESCFLLDMATAEFSDEGLVIRQVQDMHGFDHSDWFENLMIQFYLDGALMSVERNEQTLAGGAEDNILTGTYAMRPVGVMVDEKEHNSRFCPLEDGPYQAAELGGWAGYYYFRETGYFPPETEVEENADGTFTIHLYTIEETDGTGHTAASAWYTVDTYGEGKNEITGERVSLMS